MDQHGRIVDGAVLRATVHPAVLPAVTAVLDVQARQVGVDQPDLLVW